MFSKDDFQDEIRIYKLLMHGNGVSSFLSTILAVWMIFYKSPPQMKIYRWSAFVYSAYFRHFRYLLNIIFWSAAVDTYLGLFYTPMLFFPASVVCNQGLLNVANNVWFNNIQIVSVLNHILNILK
jgi:hypothetical protein